MTFIPCSHQTVLYVSLRVTREGYTRETLRQDLQRSTGTGSTIQYYAIPVISTVDDEAQVEMTNVTWGEKVKAGILDPGTSNDDGNTEEGKVEMGSE